MKIALVQMKMSDDIENNLSTSLNSIERAANSGAELVFFPELQFTKFFPREQGADTAAYLLTQDSPEIAAIRKRCGQCRVAAGINVYLSENGKAYDASLMIGADGGILGISKMVHIASFPDFYEAEYYEPSDTGFKVYNIPSRISNRKINKVGVVICFDRHFPESIRSCALQGAELIIIPSANLKSEPGEMFLWELRVQAMQSSVAIAMCNRVGTEGGAEFSGQSVVIDRLGNIVELADDGEHILLSDVHLENMEQAVYLRYRRPLKYTGLVE